MGVALEAGYDLGGLAACYLAIGLLVIAVALTQAIADAMDVSIFGSHPFRFLSRALHNSVVSALNDALRGVEGAAAHFESGLLDALGILVAIPLLAAFLVKALFQYLWNHALPALISHAISTVADDARQALAAVKSLSTTVAHNLASAERYAESQASGALSDARAYADHWIDHAVSVLHTDIAAAEHAAEAYATEAIAKLRQAEDAAIGEAVGLARAAEAAGVAAAASALHTAEGEIVAAERIAEAAAAGALARSEALGAAALAGVKSIAINLEDELHTLEGIYGAAGAAALIAAIPAIATLVQTIAVESGLERAECRGKVKGICGTDPLEWAGLLGGAAFLTGALSLREILPFARVAVDDFAGLIRQAA